MNQYDQFSLDYHWLYSDNILSGKPFIEQFSYLLDSLPSGSLLLDCSCGIGVLTIALKQQGFSVWGSDLSPGMIARARERSAEKGIEIPYLISAWKDLPTVFPNKFDLAFCLGNSIGHCSSREEMLASFQGIHTVLNRNGTLILDSRNWETICCERKRFTTTGTRKRNGLQCIPLYVWNFPKQFKEEHLIEVVFLFEDQGSVYERHYPITYHPYRYSELCEILNESGFSDIKSDFDQDKDSYTITARNGYPSDEPNADTTPRRLS
ncbi:MAG: methyltransferase domain-containing protein [Verrucomicrobiia bacterium]|jgi:2-polyprenyl-3-methyl-5-hydroxy-6-metoxy-1,4-benzoquinol methylase